MSLPDKHFPITNINEQIHEGREAGVDDLKSAKVDWAIAPNAVAKWESEILVVESNKPSKTIKSRPELVTSLCGS